MLGKLIGSHKKPLPLIPEGPSLEDVEVVNQGRTGWSMFGCVCGLLTCLAGACTAGDVLHASRRWTTTCACTPARGRTRAAPAASRTSTVPGCGSTWHRLIEVSHAAVDWTPPCRSHRVIANNPASSRPPSRARYCAYCWSVLVCYSVITSHLRRHLWRMGHVSPRLPKVYCFQPHKVWLRLCAVASFYGVLCPPCTRFWQRCCH